MQEKGRNINGKRILLHSFFWMVWIVGFTILQCLGKGKGEVLVWSMYYIITLPIFIIHTYLIAYWLVPYYFLKRKFVFFTIGIIVLLFLFSVVELIVSNLFVFSVFDPVKKFAPGYLNIKNIFISGLGNHYIILVFLAIRVVKSWYITKNQKEELAQQNLETEIEIYRYQLQPKFILSLIEELEQMVLDGSIKAPDMIVKISDFLNSLFYEAKSELIPLNVELELMEKFSRIQEMAFGKRLKTNFVITGNIMSKLVPPLLIFPHLNRIFKEMYTNTNIFECKFIIKAEKKYLLLSFSIWSEDEFEIPEDKNKMLFNKRLEYNYGNNYTFNEIIDTNFNEISIEIFN